MSARRTLTATQVAGIKQDGVHWVAPSLYMQVRSGQGTRSWLFRYSRNDTNQWMGLGSTGDKRFCFTGRFHYGSRNDCVKAVLALGATDGPISRCAVSSIL